MDLKGSAAVQVKIRRSNCAITARASDVAIASNITLWIGSYVTDLDP